MAKIIGIDLGTTNSEVAVMEAGKPTIIKSSEGNNYFPSVVAFTKDGELLVGETAKRQAVTNPEGTVHRVKRKMGSGEKIKSFNLDIKNPSITHLFIKNQAFILYDQNFQEYDSNGEFVKILSENEVKAFLLSEKTR